MKNPPSCLEHSECPLHIFSCRCLHRCKVALFVALGIRYGLHKRHSLRIGIIDKIVSPLVVTIVDNVVARQRSSIEAHICRCENQTFQRRHAKSTNRVMPLLAVAEDETILRCGELLSTIFLQNHYRKNDTKIQK